MRVIGPNQLTIKEFSIVDKPAQEGAVIALEKRAAEKGKDLPRRVLLSKAAPEIAKAMDISSYLYTWEIRDEFDLEWSITRFEEHADNDLPVHAKYIQSRAETLGLTELLPTDGVFAESVMKSKTIGEQTTKKEADMPDKEPTAKELQERLDAVTKERDSLKAEAEKAAEVSKAESSEEVYKARDGITYTDPEKIALAKRIDTVEENVELEKRVAEVASHLPGDMNVRKAIVKAIDGIDSEAERKAAQEFVKSINDERKKAFVAKGDAGTTEATNAADEFEQLVQKRMDEHKESFQVATARVVADNPDLTREAL